MTRLSEVLAISTRRCAVGATVTLGLVALLAVGGCTPSSDSSGSGGSGSGGKVGGGSGGSSGTDAGSGGSSVGSGGSVVPGSGGAAPTDVSTEMAAEAPPVPCPGAGKSLEFKDDVGGTTTNSMQVLADLGDDTPIGDSARTIEFWAYMEGNESWKAEHSIVEYGGTGRCEAFGIDGGDSGARTSAQFDPFTFSSPDTLCRGDNNFTITPAPPRMGWLHLAWVYDPAGKLSYNNMQNLNFMFTVNGVPQPIMRPTQLATGKLLTKKTLVSIGSGERDVNQGFTGKIDEFRMWNVARTAKEIADNYKSILKGDEPGLVAYYHFDDGTGTMPKDSSSKHHDAMFAANHPPPAWVDSTDLMLDCK